MVMASKNVSYETPVVDIWPEFGRNGKEKTTISHIVLHQVRLGRAGRRGAKRWRTIQRRVGGEVSRMTL